MSPQDYYGALGISRDASAQEVKRAYRQAAIRWHPDRNPGDKEAEERFKEAAEAYAVLGDPEKRARYDRFGPGGVGGTPFGGFDSEVFADFSDILGQFFGAGFADLFGGARREAARRGADLRYDLAIDFVDAARGCSVDVVIPRRTRCEQCDGTGSATPEGSTGCGTCGGRGQVRLQQGFFAVSRTCGACRGQGRVVVDPCRSCQGTGLRRQERKVALRIPSGVEHGTRLRLVGEGEDGARGAPAGDLYVFLTVRPHEFFERDGLDLHCRFPLSFPQAALGAEVEVPSLEGTEQLKVPAGTQSGSVLRLRGKGIRSPEGAQVGDQYVHVQVMVPTRLTKRQREILESLADTDPRPLDGRDKNFFEKVKELFR